MRMTGYLFTFFTFTATLPAAAGVVVSVTPLTSQAKPGDMLLVEIGINGLDVERSLGAYDLSLDYDSELLHFEHLSFGDSLLGDQLALTDSPINQFNVSEHGGSVELISLAMDDSATLLANQAKRFALASLRFSALSDGISPLQLSLHSLSDQDGRLIDATSQSATVTLAGVPLPSSLWLFASGSAALFARRKTF